MKIPAGWGQNLNFELSVVDEGRVDDQLFEDAVKEFEFALLNPAQESVDLIGATTSDVTDVNKPVRFGTARAVSFANADQPNPAWLAGDHYLAVTLARNIGDNTDEKTLSVPVRYQIAFAHCRRSDLPRFHAAGRKRIDVHHLSVLCTVQRRRERRCVIH